MLLRRRLEETIRSDGGFTLIELIIVIAIIGILVAIAIPVYSGIQDSAKKARLLADLDNLTDTYSNTLAMWGLDSAFGDGDLLTNWDPEDPAYTELVVDSGAALLDLIGADPEEVSMQLSFGKPIGDYDRAGLVYLHNGGNPAYLCMNMSYKESDIEAGAKCKGTLVP